MWFRMGEDADASVSRREGLGTAESETLREGIAHLGFAQLRRVSAVQLDDVVGAPLTQQAIEAIAGPLQMRP